MPPVVDEQSPSPSPSRSPFRLGFLPATPDDLPPSDLPSPSPSPESLDDAAPASDSGDEWDAASYPESLDDTPSPGSTPGSDAPEAVKVDLFREDDLQAMARAGVAMAGEKAHELLATTEGKRQVGLYLTDEADQAQIGDPLGRIAARHRGVAGKVNPDTQDVLASLVGVFGWAAKQVQRSGAARAIDQGSGNPQPLPEPVDL